MVAEPSISIIVPVYNAALYLDECISSILNQSFSSFELICVDDGSSDDSLKILNTYSEDDPRIKILMQGNRGAGIARNLGLQHAVGKYVLFLDADDFFERDMLYKIFSIAEDKSADIVVCNADEYDTLNSNYYNAPLIYYHPGIKAFFSAFDVPEYVFNFTVPAPWNKLFRRRFISEHGILFQDLRSTNDLFFVYAALSCCSRIAILDEVLVHYRVNNKHSLQGSRNKDTVDAFRALVCLKEFLLSRKMFLRYTYSFKKLVGSVGVYTLANVPADRFKKDVRSKRLCKILSVLIEENSEDEVNFNCEKIVIYGAGLLTVVLIRCLTELVGIKKDNINVVVSTLGHNGKMICDIPIIEINKCNIEENIIVFICSVVPKSRQEMMSNAKKLGYRHICLFDNIKALRLYKMFCCDKQA